MHTSKKALLGMFAFFEGSKLPLLGLEWGLKTLWISESRELWFEDSARKPRPIEESSGKHGRLHQ